MREDLLGQDSMSNGLQHSDGDKRRIGTRGVNHVKTNFLDISHGATSTRRCVMFLSYWSWVVEDFEIK